MCIQEDSGGVGLLKQGTKELKPVLRDMAHLSFETTWTDWKSLQQSLEIASFLIDKQTNKGLIRLCYKEDFIFYNAFIVVK